MATTESTSSSPGPADPVDIPVALSLQKSGQSDHCMPSPVFSPICKASSGARPPPFELSSCEGEGQQVEATPCELRAVATPGVEAPTLATELLEQVRAVLNDGGNFVPAEEGDGVWIITSRSGRPVAVWKTQDGCEDRSRTSTAIENGCAYGQRAQREYMAYLVDQALPRVLRAGVPPTLLVELRAANGIRQIASIQRFVESKGTSEDWGASRYDCRNVQRIALFDVLTLNLDRHGGNMLVGHDNQLVPIDHGYSLPETLAGEPWLDWRLWPQASGTVDPELRSAIMGLSPLMTMPFATALGLPDGVWKTADWMIRNLQRELESGATLRMIAETLMRDPGATGSTTDVKVVDGFVVECPVEDLDFGTTPRTVGINSQVD